MTRMEFRRDLHKSPEPLRRTPIHFGRYLFKGNAPVVPPPLWGGPIDFYPLYNSRYLPVIQEERG